MDRPKRPNQTVRSVRVCGTRGKGDHATGTPPGQATSGHEKPQTLTAPNYLRRRRFQCLGVDVTARAGETVHVQTGRASTVQQAQIFEAVSQPRK